MKRLLEGDATPMERMLLEAGRAEEPVISARLHHLPSPRRISGVSVVAAFAFVAGVALFAYARTKPGPTAITAAPEASLILVTSAPPPAPAAPAARTTAAMASVSSAPSAPPLSGKLLAMPKAQIAQSAAPVAPAPGVGTPFDKSAAVRALGIVDVQACFSEQGPVGSGHVTVTFEPTTGAAASAVVDDDRFKGTAVGGCIAAKFKAATVPPFDGTPVRVGKSFVVVVR